MKIIVGLGNPGPRYETTRHNVGFLAIDRLSDEWRANGPTRQFDAESYQTDFRGERVLMLKPQTYMNNSGKSVAAAFKFFKCEPDDLIVIHDDLDLKLHALRIKTGGGTGGHNGLKSIDACLGAGLLNYHRIRVGIGRPAEGTSQISPADYVLQQYTDQELQTLDPTLESIVKAAGKLIEGDVKGAQNEFNRERTPASETE